MEREEEWAALLLSAQQMLAEGDHGAVRELCLRLDRATYSPGTPESIEVAEVRSATRALLSRFEVDGLGLTAGVIAVIVVLLLLLFTG